MSSKLRDNDDRKQEKIKPTIIRKVFKGFYCAVQKTTEKETNTSSSIPIASKRKLQNKTTINGQSQRIPVQKVAKKAKVEVPPPAPQTFDLLQQIQQDMTKTHRRAPKVPVKKMKIDKVEQDWRPNAPYVQDWLNPNVSTPQHCSFEDQAKKNALESLERERDQYMKQGFTLREAWVKQQRELNNNAQQQQKSKEPLPLPQNLNNQQNPSQQIRKPSRCPDFTKPTPWNYEFRAREHESFEEWCERAIAQFQRGLTSEIKHPMSIEDRAKLRGITLPAPERIGCEIPWSYDDCDNTAEKVGQRQSNSRKRQLSTDDGGEEYFAKRVRPSAVNEECSFDDLLSAYKTEQHIRIHNIKLARW
uniref:Uncharacterized protein n=1 Tax=Clytia hemisphaerica TaxID=252671 RepID=A0A7M5WTA8_9CNID